MPKFDIQRRHPVGIIRLGPTGEMRRQMRSLEAFGNDVPERTGHEIRKIVPQFAEEQKAQKRPWVVPRNADDRLCRQILYDPARAAVPGGNPGQQFTLAHALG